MSDWYRHPPTKRVWALIYLPYNMQAPNYPIAQYEPSRKSWGTLVGDEYPLNWMTIHWHPLPDPPANQPALDPRIYATEDTE